MAKFFDALDDKTTAFVTQQPLFFVATAPLAADGHVNLSPKGLDTFRVLSPTRCAYLDLTGSGNETAAHLLENGRLTLMFCSFGASPQILRIYGRGRPVLPDAPGWDELAPHFEILPGTRQIFDIGIEFVQTSCGWGVPRLAAKGERQTLVQVAEARGEDEMAAYRAEKNRQSLDGLPAGQPADPSVPEPSS